MNGALRSAARGAARMTSGDRAGTLLRLLFAIALLEVALWAPLPVGVLFGDRRAVVHHPPSQQSCQQRALPRTGSEADCCASRGCWARPWRWR